MTRITEMLSFWRKKHHGRSQSQTRKPLMPTTDTSHIHPTLQSELKSQSHQSQTSDLIQSEFHSIQEPINPSHHHHLHSLSRPHPLITPSPSLNLHQSFHLQDIPDIRSFAQHPTPLSLLDFLHHLSIHHHHHHHQPGSSQSFTVDIHSTTPLSPTSPGNQTLKGKGKRTLDESDPQPDQTTSISPFGSITSRQTSSGSFPFQASLCLTKTSYPDSLFSDPPLSPLPIIQPTPSKKPRLLVVSESADGAHGPIPEKLLGDQASRTVHGLPLHLWYHIFSLVDHQALQDLIESHRFLDLDPVTSLACDPPPQLLHRALEAQAHRHDLIRLSKSLIPATRPAAWSLLLLEQPTRLQSVARLLEASTHLAAHVQSLIITFNTSPSRQTPKLERPSMFSNLKIDPTPPEPLTPRKASLPLLTTPKPPRIYSQERRIHRLKKCVSLSYHLSFLTAPPPLAIVDLTVPPRGFPTQSVSLHPTSRWRRRGRAAAHQHRSTLTAPVADGQFTRLSRHGAPLAHEPSPRLAQRPGRVARQAREPDGGGRRRAREAVWARRWPPPAPRTRPPHPRRHRRGLEPPASGRGPGAVLHARPGEHGASTRRATPPGPRLGPQP